MASAGSCRTGLRSLPSNGAGPSRVKGFDVSDDEEQEGDADRALHREHVGLAAARQIVAEGRDRRAEQREDQHPEQHRAFVIAPDAGDLVEQRLGRMRVLPDILHREVGDRRRPQSAPQKASAMQANCDGAAGAATRDELRVARRAAPSSGSTVCTDQRRRTRGSARNGRVSTIDSAARSAGVPPSPSCQTPCSFSARRPRAACSSRRAWRARCRR